MPTISQHRSRRSPAGDYQARCGCGVMWYRSELWLDEDGILRCPDEGRGPSRRELDREYSMRRSRKFERAIPSGAKPTLSLHEDGLLLEDGIGFCVLQDGSGYCLLE